MKTKLFLTYCLLELCLSFALFASPIPQSRKTKEQNKREADSLGGLLIKQQRGDIARLTKEVKRLKESIKSLNALKDRLEDSLEREIQRLNDTISSKEDVIRTLNEFLAAKRDTIQQLCRDTANYGIRFGNLTSLNEQKDDLLKTQTATLEEYKKTIETLRTTFTETQQFLKDQNSLFQHHIDSLKTFIQVHLPPDTAKTIIPHK